ncbi:hypothetical protein [Flavobacterium selenitireducens]|uniref:hypothetical protein n=1 Tax=Flavobacterium selenitireducens TaxID=2722704 RepID=UPI00168B52ED|nr:hypothetical protein [Flavobacterium selenitireducens]MBD3584034.1 hypothetical protein [Flavobacterium selenitireducens]
MKKIILISLITIASCSKKDSTDFNLPNPDDINQVVSVISKEYSLPFLKTVIRKNRRPFSKELRKIYISFTPKQGNLPFPRFADSIYAQTLLSYNMSQDKTLTKRDSSYFKFQNESVKNFTINKELQDEFIIAKNLELPFYDMTIPIFSPDNNKAFVIVKVNNTGIEDPSYEVILNKEKGKWCIKKY